MNLGVWNRSNIDTPKRFVCSIIDFVSSDDAGVSSDGFSITLLPDDKIPANGAKARFSGKFHGLIAPTTPLDISPLSDVVLQVLEPSVTVPAI